MILTQIFIYGFFISEEKSKIISDTLINELNNAQNNDYKAKIIEFMLSRQILYTNHEEKLYNCAMELINNENHNDRYLKANTLLECCINNILVHNHEEELYNLLSET